MIFKGGVERLRKLLLILVFLLSFGFTSTSDLPIYEGKYDLKCLADASRFNHNSILEKLIGYLFGLEKNEVTKNASPILNITDESNLNFYFFVLDSFMKYGSISLGKHNSQRFEFAYQSGKTNIRQLYFDQNQDGYISKNETFPTKELPMPVKRFLGKEYDVFLSMVPNLPVFISYKKSNGSVINKKITINFYLSKEVARTSRKDEPPYEDYQYFKEYQTVKYYAWYQVNTCFQGEIPGKDQEPARQFLIIDKNNNAVFNDLDEDLITFRNSKAPNYVVNTLRDYINQSKLNLNLYEYPASLIVKKPGDPVPNSEELEPNESDT